MEASNKLLEAFTYTLSNDNLKRQQAEKFLEMVIFNPLDLISMHHSAQANLVIVRIWCWLSTIQRYFLFPFIMLAKTLNFQKAGFTIATICSFSFENTNNLSLAYKRRKEIHPNGRTDYDKE